MFIGIPLFIKASARLDENYYLEEIGLFWCFWDEMFYPMFYPLFYPLK